MKFKKTLLAAALTITGFSVQAATEANVTKYQANNINYIVVDEIVKGQPGLLKVGQWYTENAGKLEVTEKPTGTLEKVAAGMVEYAEVQGSGTSITETKTNSNQFIDNNAGKNDYWSISTADTTSTTAGKEPDFILEGTLVNANQNGNTAEVNQTFTGTYVGKVVGETKDSTVNAKKDIQVGNLTQVAKGANTGGLAEYDFDLIKNTAQGALATIKEIGDTGTSVAAVTGKGLAVLSVPKGGLVDLEKGTVSFETTSKETVAEKNISLTSYNDGTNEVVKIGTGSDAKYYLATQDAIAADDKVLTEYQGDISKLTQTGYGLADKTSGGQTITETNVGLVSNKNVKYGEAVTKQDNAGKFKVSSSTPKEPTSISGGTYNIDTLATKTTTSKDVVTGIISVDDGGSKTYGLQATTVVDNEVTGQTTVTAEGITTTGTVSAAGFLINGESITSTVDKAVTVANTAIDKKIAEVDSRLTQFNSTADRLNSRINDVKETAYSGVAIALAAQQQVPNIGAGQVAVFGGAGHYEGETAGALGLVGVLADGRTSLSGALGVGGSGDVGGRVGVAYVFGGK